MLNCNKMLASFSFSDNTIGFLIDGVLDDKTHDNLKRQVFKRFKGHNKVNLYMEDASIVHFKIRSVLSNCAFKIRNSKKINKIAVVTDKNWIHVCCFLDNLFLSTSVRSFKIKDRLEAISWIAETNS
jgi:hypothetical protein